MKGYKNAFGALAALLVAGLALGPGETGAQTAKKLKCKGCVKSKQIKNNGIAGKDIKNNTIGAGKIQNNAIGSDKIADGAVTTAKLADETLAGAATAVSACGTLSQPGAYRVIQNITATGTCILVAADFVTLDLNGFAISGNGTGTGVGQRGSVRQGLALRNGTIENFSDGVNVINTSDCIIDDLRLLDNAGTGIVSGTGCRVTHNIIAGSGGRNIEGGLANLISRNVVEGAGGDGIRVGRGSIVSENIVNGNGGIGVVIAQGTLVTSNAIGENTGRGIDTREGGFANKSDSTITNNVVAANTGAGISYSVSDDGLLLANNTFRSNSGGNSTSICDNCTIVHNVGVAP